MSHVVESDYGLGKKKLGIYSLGIALCVLLTLIPFGVVMNPMFSRPLTFSIVYGAAVLQFLVQVICFLRLNTHTEQSRTNLFSFVFVIVILLAVVIGSLWIMWNLHYYMALS